MPSAVVRWLRSEAAEAYQRQYLPDLVAEGDTSVGRIGGTPMPARTEVERLREEVADSQCPAMFVDALIAAVRAEEQETHRETPCPCCSVTPSEWSTTKLEPAGETWTQQELDEAKARAEERLKRIVGENRAATDSEAEEKPSTMTETSKETQSADLFDRVREIRAGIAMVYPAMADAVDGLIVAVSAASRAEERGKCLLAVESIGGFDDLQHADLREAIRGLGPVADRSTRAHRRTGSSSRSSSRRLHVRLQVRRSVSWATDVWFVQIEIDGKKWRTAEEFWTEGDAVREAARLRAAFAEPLTVTDGRE
jgi:hypothetical protein